MTPRIPRSPRARRVSEGTPVPYGHGATYTAARIEELLHALDGELAKVNVTGELYVVGGAVMCLAFGARETTRDVDALFVPTQEIRAAAARVADAAEVPRDWLNDAVKGFLSVRGAYDPYLELPHLRVFVARADYLFAMKCVAMRSEVGTLDQDDVRFLLRYLGITEVNAALEIVEQYFDKARIPLKTQLALEEMLGGPRA